MVSIKKIRENKEWYENELKKRLDDSYLEHFKKFLELDNQWLELKKQIDDLRHQRNEISQKISKYKKEGKDIKELLEKAKQIPKKISELEEKQKQISEQRYEILLLLPNEVDESVPIGGEKDFEVIEYFGKPKVKKENVEEFKKENEKCDFEEVESDKIMSHYDLVDKFDLIDSETAGEIAGSRFYIEKNELVKLDLAIILHAIDFYQKKGFNNVMMPPFMIKNEVEKKITHYDTFKEAIFHVKEDDLLLITTSEHPIAAMFAGKNIEKTKIPLRIVAWSPAFRREAGSHGKDTKGIFRVKQFHKVELHSIVDKKNEMNELNFLIEATKDYMKELGLPFRLVKLASGDIDKRAKIQYDIETWFPNQGKFRETHSIATVGDWISTKIHTKIDKENAVNLYATGVAVQRMICAILENNYDPKTNTIKIPKVLTKYTGFDRIKLKK